MPKKNDDTFKISNLYNKFNSIFFQLFYLQFLINSIKNQCLKNAPILVNNQCELKYCTEEEYQRNDCIIANEIIKIQWLTKIIRIGDLNFRYINFAEYSNGDLIVETTACPGSAERMFFGIDTDGRGLFKSEDVTEGRSFYYSIKVGEQPGNSEGFRYESENFIATINSGSNIGKEYLVSFSKSVQFTELFIFDQRKINQKQTKSVLGYEMINIRPTSISYTYNDINYSLLGCKTSIDNTNHLYIKRFLFNNNEFTNTNPTTKEYKKAANIGGSISCYASESKYIYCCYIDQIEKQFWSTTYTVNYFCQLALNQDLNELTTSCFSDYINSDENAFVKCIYLKGEAGAYTYYSSYNYPIFLFKNFNRYSNFEDYLSKPYIKLDYYVNNYNIYFNKYCLKNDFIKITENKLCYITSSSTNDTLYISILNIFQLKDVIIRYYSINIFKLNNYKILLDMRGHLYKNFVALAFSYCRNEICYSDKVGEHYSAFLLFSYPEQKNKELNIKEYLFEYNDIKIKNIIIDIKKNVKIDNNLFGYEYKGIKLMENECDNINILSSISNSQIEINATVEEEKIKLEFKDDSYEQMNCGIKYRYILTDPLYENYRQYVEEDNQYGYFDQNTYNSQTDNYEGKINLYNIIIEEDLDINCEKNCELCIKNNISYCITCLYNYTINESKYKICSNPPFQTDIPEEKEEEIEEEKGEEKEEIEEEVEKINENTKTQIKTEITDKTEENKLYSCTNPEIIEHKCEDGFMQNNQVDEIFHHIKENILKNDYKGENNVIKTENVIFQLSKFEDQKNNDIPNISSIDLGECEILLKEKHKIPSEESLLIIKTDIKNDDLTATNVQYEIYNPLTLDKLDMNICKEVKITVNSPKNLNDDTLSLYDRLSESGYNLFDTEDDFYNDICSTYTSNNGTDMTLEDRKKEIFGTKGNIYICQKGCSFKFYNKTTKKAKCDCEPQKELIETNLTLITFGQSFLSRSFLRTLKNSNFLVLKCYKLAFNISYLFKNLGRIIMTLIAIFFVILLIIYCIKDRKNINYNLEALIKNNITYFKKSLNNKKESNQLKNKSNKKIYQKSLKNEKKIKKIKTKNYNKKKDNNIINNFHDKQFPPKKKNNVKIQDKKSLDISKNANTNANSTSNNNLLQKIKSTKKLGLNINIIPINNVHYNKYKKSENKKSLNRKNNIEIYKSKSLNNLENPKKSKKNLITNNSFINKNNFNDKELNNLDYESAIIYDKRTYFQYYCSLLKKKQIILFTFLPAKDYNLRTLKISLFLISFSLYFTINGFFFDDNTMHKIYEAKGTYNIIILIPQIIYSSIISVVINSILKMLALSERDILLNKKVKYLNSAIKRSKQIEKCLKIKFFLFFMICIILLIFFWYFISCFCAVYTNTQIILIKDTLFSFGLSMIYPFGLCFFPGFFRIPALRNKNKDKNCLYKISRLISFI